MLVSEASTSRSHLILVLQDTSVIILYDFPLAPHNLTLQTSIITYPTFKENNVLIQIQKCYKQICNGYSVEERFKFKQSF